MKDSAPTMVMRTAATARSGRDSSTDCLSPITKATIAPTKPIAASATLMRNSSHFIASDINASDIFRKRSQPEGVAGMYMLPVGEDQPQAEQPQHAAHDALEPELGAAIEGACRPAREQQRQQGEPGQFVERHD